MRTLQERFEGTAVGRAVISIFLIFTLGAIVVTSTNGNSAIHQRLIGTTQPYLNAVGLDQNWGVFAPDPRRQQIELKAELTYPDGRTTTWHPPGGDPVVGASREYRWRKFVEFAVSPDYGDFWRGISLYIARNESRDGQVPRHVTLISRFRASFAAGQGPSFGPWQESRFFEFDTPTSELEASTR